MTNGNDAAFVNRTLDVDACHEMLSPSLSKREYFAALAMQGLLASGTWVGGDAEITTGALILADQLITALNNSRPTETQK